MEQKLIATNLGYSSHKKDLLSHVSLSFDSGCLHGILGPNGSGKSTFLKMLAGIWKPTSGTLLWNGAPLLSKPRLEISRIVSLVPQNPQVSFDYLVEDIVAMGRYAYDRCYWLAAEEPKVYEALTMVDAWQLRRRRVNQLSFGERQRVYIARALVSESPILLLDEPTSSLDIQHQIEIWQLLGEIVKGGKIVIVTTHDLTVAERYCHRIAVLNEGKCIGDGRFADLMTADLLDKVFGVKESQPVPCKQYELS